MGLRCFLFGHKPARLLGLDKNPLIVVSSDESRMQIRIDYCRRCGLVYGAHMPLNIPIKEKVESLRQG